MIRFTSGFGHLAEKLQSAMQTSLLINSAELCQHQFKIKGAVVFAPRATKASEARELLAAQGVMAS